MEQPERKNESCPECGGAGHVIKKIKRLEHIKTCLKCDGKGHWEVVCDDNYYATQLLKKQEGEYPDKIIKLCNARLAGITPDNIFTVLDRLQEGLIPGNIEQQRFDGLHKAGSRRWGWAWFNTNQFAVELAKLNKADPHKWRYALSSLSFGWLSNESKSLK